MYLKVDGTQYRDKVPHSVFNRNSALDMSMSIEHGEHDLLGNRHLGGGNHHRVVDRQSDNAFGSEVK